MNQEGSNNKEIELQRQDESKIEGLDESDDDEEFDEKFIQDQLNATVWSDLKQSVYDVRYLIPIIALLGILLAYQMTIAPYRTNIVDNMIGQNSKDLKTIRPVLTDEVLKNIQYIMLRQENEIEMPFPDSGSFTMRFVQSVDKHGTHELPDMFYEGVMFGISSANSHKVEYSRLQPDRTSKALYDDLLEMKPTPTHVLRRLATCNNTEWNEKGYGVYFSYKDLQTQGMLSSDTLQPWKRVLEPILWKARKFKQVYITVWYPYQFGDPVTTEKITYPPRKYRHMNIIQSVLPTRTGLDGLKSTSAVWMMEKNNTRVEILPRLVRGPVVPEYEQFVSVDNF